MKTLNKLIVTTLRGRTAAVLVSEKRILQIDFEGKEASDQIGAIYIGKVRNIVKNLNAAFVEYRPGVNGYYSLNENMVHHFADGSTSGRPLKSGDEILVQIERAAVKTKDAVLTSTLTLTGRYVVAALQEPSLGISTKIKDKQWKNVFKNQWENSDAPKCGVIIRTNALQAEFSDVLQESIQLWEKLKKLCQDAAYRTVFSNLFQPDSFAVSMVRDIRLHDTEEIVTDIPEVYRELADSGLIEDVSASDDMLSLPHLRFYEDTYPLTALYHLETSLERALSKTVWLKSGGYLVIEPTEAMTVIDVNTGKNTEKKSSAEVYFKTNLEAAAEIAAQLQLRNLSGIIIIDFIDMKEESHNTELMQYLRKCLSKDPVKTAVVDMTALGLVEVTRKKTKRPLHEQIRENN